MESITDRTPLIVVLGPTASGKTQLSLDLAQRFNGEIIAADSRTVYRGMDIGTAKPTKEALQLVPHHLIDVVDPDQPFTVAQFQRLARQAIDEIHERGRLPILVGGTGLYIDAVIYNFSFRVGDTSERRQLEQLDVDQLQSRILDKGIPLPNNPNNPRHLIRTLETGGRLPSRDTLRPRTLVIGIMPDQDVLQNSIRHRAEEMIRAGLVQEATGLAGQYGWDAPALQTPEYKAMHKYLDGSMTLDETKEFLIRGEIQYAKRQKTWFKRDKNITWISKPEECVDLVTTFLNN